MQLVGAREDVRSWVLSVVSGLRPLIPRRRWKDSPKSELVECAVQ